MKKIIFDMTGRRILKFKRLARKANLLNFKIYT